MTTAHPADLHSQHVDDNLATATATATAGDPSKFSSLDTRENETYRLVVLFLPPPTSGSARWPRSGWLGSTCIAIAR